MSNALLKPLPLAAIAVMVPNDHLLKWRFPCWFTGKLSDVAGMIFFPLFLFALVETFARTHATRRALVLCVVVTACVFALVKTCPLATFAYSMIVGALQWPFRAVSALLDGDPWAPASTFRAVVAYTDPSDLLAVPFASLALLAGARRTRAIVAPGLASVPREGQERLRDNVGSLA